MQRVKIYARGTGEFRVDGIVQCSSHQLLLEVGNVSEVGHVGEEAVLLEYGHGDAETFGISKKKRERNNVNSTPYFSAYSLTVDPPLRQRSDDHCQRHRRRHSQNGVQAGTTRHFGFSPSGCPIIGHWSLSYQNRQQIELPG